MTPRSTHPPPILAVSNDEPRLAEVMNRLDDGVVLLDEAITELADLDAAHGIAQLIARRIQLAPDTIARALDAQSEEPVAIVCRAAGLNINGFSAVLRMWRRRHPSERSPAVALAAFHDLSPETARRVAGLLKTREAG